MTFENMVILEDQAPFSQSILWKWQREFFDKAAIAAWQCISICRARTGWIRKLYDFPSASGLRETLSATFGKDAVQSAWSWMRLPFGVDLNQLSGGFAVFFDPTWLARFDPKIKPRQTAGP